MLDTETKVKVEKEYDTSVFLITLVSREQTVALMGTLIWTSAVLIFTSKFKVIESFLPTSEPFLVEQTEFTSVP